MLILGLAPILMTIHLVLTYPARRLQQSAHSRGGEIWLILTMILATLISLGAVVLPFVLSIRYLYSNGISLSSLLFFRFELVRDSLIAAGVGVGYFGYLKLVTRLTGSLSPNQTAVMGIAAILVSPFCEEIIFRGYGKVYCDMNHIGDPMAALLTAVLFALAHMHIGGVLEKPSLWQASYSVFLDTVFGLSLYYLYLVTGSLMTPILSHSALNAALFYCGRSQQTLSTSRP